MPWPATARYGLEPASGSLGLLQDLLNTVAAGSPRLADLLDDLGTAQLWVDHATGEWSQSTGQPMPGITLDVGGLAELRAFRGFLQALVAEGADADRAAETAATVLYAATGELRFGADGLVRLEPRGADWQRLAARVVAEAFEGERAGIRSRLKICRNPRCRVAFLDRIRSHSRVWHDVKTCGSAANLRARRARRRTAEAVPGQAE